MEQEHKPLKDLILERLEVKNLNLEKTFQLTEIPKHYLEAIFKGDWEKLPAAPYAHGYFKKLGLALEMDGNELWNLCQNEAEVIRASGSEDKLPENRFAIKSKNHKWFWPALTALAVAVYVLLNANSLIGQPKLTVENPLSATLVTSLPNYEFTGKMDARDKLFINNEEVYVDKNGQFQKDYGLQPGLNTFEILAKRFLGQETKVVKQIIYQPNEQKGK